MTLGSGSCMRGTADFNLKTGDDSAVRLNALVNRSRQRRQPASTKQGIAPTFRWGIGTRRVLGRPLPPAVQERHQLASPGCRTRSARPSNPDAYYGAASDTTDGGTTTHGHARAPLRRRQRAAHGAAHRPLRARPARQRDPLRRRGVQQPGGVAVSPATIGAGTVLTRGSQNRSGHGSVYLQATTAAASRRFGRPKHAVSRASTWRSTTSTATRPSRRPA